MVQQADMLADADQGGYRLVVECSAATAPWQRATVRSVERELSTLNLEYSAKRASGRLRPLELLPVRAGTGEAYKRHCLQRGQREGQFKIIALQYQSECVFPFADFQQDLPGERST